MRTFGTRSTCDWIDDHGSDTELYFQKIGYFELDNSDLILLTCDSIDEGGGGCPGEDPA